MRLDTRGWDRRRRWLATLAVLALGASVTVPSTWAAFSATTANSANTMAAGSVSLTDNDTDAAMLNLSGMTPGATDTKCLQVTYTGTLPSLVRAYATTSATGLD